MQGISLDQPLARGRTADVYVWDDTRILKLFHNWFGLESIEYEMKIARAVHSSGVKAPAVGDLVQVEGRSGLIYERVQGETMLKLFQTKPWKLFVYAKILAQLHAQMHERNFDADVLTQQQRLRHKIDQAKALTASQKDSLLNALNSMPEGNCICHGDFHPDNIMISGNDAIVIDWSDASRGNPLADVARTSIILLGVAQNSDPFLRIAVGSFHRSYLSQYFRLRPEGKKEYQRWLPIVAGARLNEGISELEEWLIKQVGKL